MKPIVSILVLTYNRLHLSSRYIPLILDHAGNIPVEMLIWDNGSEDGSYDWSVTFGQADCRVAHVIGHPENIGMEAFNPLAEKAQGKYIIKVDDDIEVPNCFAERLVAAYETAKEEIVLQFYLEFADRTIEIENIGYFQK